MIKMKELNPHGYATSDETQANLDDLLDKLNVIRKAYGKPMYINSGLRSQVDQQRINPSAPKSKHLIGCAADVRDNDGKFWEWCQDNWELMEELDLYFENPAVTKGWLHIQTLAPRSGKRVFNP